MGTDFYSADFVCMSILLSVRNEPGCGFEFFEIQRLQTFIVFSLWKFRILGYFGQDPSLLKIPLGAQPIVSLVLKELCWNVKTWVMNFDLRVTRVKIMSSYIFGNSRVLLRIQGQDIELYKLIFFPSLIIKFVFQFNQRKSIL